MFVLVLKIKISQNTSVLLSICKLATSFDLPSHHQAIMNRINIGALSGSANMCTAASCTSY